MNSFVRFFFTGFFLCAAQGAWAVDTDKDGIADSVDPSPNDITLPGYQPLATFVGGAAYDFIGSSVDAVGDINIDGYPDFAYGNFRGVGTVISGADNSVLFLCNQDSQTLIIRGAGDVNNDGIPDVIAGGRYGVNVCSGVNGDSLLNFPIQSRDVDGVGDVNGDNYDDVVVVSNYIDKKVVVYSGIDGSEIHSYTSTGTDANPAAVTGLGDVNGNGYPDFAYSHPFSNVNGQESGTVWIKDGNTGSTLFEFNGSAGDQLGHSLGNAGDVNGDNINDLIVGVAGYNNWTGSSRIYSGANGAILHTFYPDDDGDNAGYSVAGVGDINQDGYDDVIVGAICDSNFAYCSGSARVYSGFDGAIIYTFNGTVNSDQFGWSVSSAGDVNLDGYPDILIGATYDDDNGADTGTVFLFSGKEYLKWVDTDGDGIANINDADDDNDFLPDTWEVANGTNPLIKDYTVDIGNNNGCAVTDSGIECWGNNDNGKSTPPGLVNPSKVGNGLNHACAMNNNEIVCWGANNVGQTNVPAGLGNLESLSVGHVNACAIEKHKLECWGDATTAINSTPSVSRPKEVSVGYDHACVTDSNGVQCWGDNTSGEATVPGLTNPRQISTGKNYTCVIENSGVTCWGDNANGKATPPAIAGALLLDAGDDHACVTNAVSVQCWGLNDEGQTTVPSGIKNPIAVVAGAKFSCVLDEEGVKCWGANADNQSSVPNLNIDPDQDGCKHKNDAFPLDPSECIDTDGDGIGNNADTDDDGDGLLDIYELTNGTNPLVFTTFAELNDSDGDGITDSKETAIGTNPFLADSDGDGISDDVELLTWCTNAMSQDSDGDGILDNVDAEPDGDATCTLPLNGLYKGTQFQQGVGP